MAFKQKSAATVVPNEPRDLLKTLTKRKIQDLLQHQGETLKRYHEMALSDPDVAIQLPTGSGKTLVGLMIAEWRRRKFNERVVYLCPTKQLVNQVAAQAEGQYGLLLSSFTGSKELYTPEQKQTYKQSERVAVTTYQSLFNVKPFFDEPDLIIIDDAHAAENYISGMWSLSINKIDHRAIFESFASILRPHIGNNAFHRISEEPTDIIDATWVDKVPTPAVRAVSAEVIELLDRHLKEPSQRFPWSKIKDHLLACHIYVSPIEILIRPIISPTWTHRTFSGAKQRIYMSATLGQSGDLERLTGRSKITRVPAPDGWDRQGIGRRFFVFPSYSLTQEESTVLRLKLMEDAGRSLVAVPSDRAARAVAEQVEEVLKFPVFNASDIEESKMQFIEKDQAVAIVANRYDGIDFPDDECRLLFVDGLPTATNLQERFIASRMGAIALINERIQTRVLQAVGRCTRSLTDRSAVVIMGETVSDYFGDPKRRSLLHPELQAELAFGITQSREMSADDIVENVAALLNDTDDWANADQEIFADREKYTQEVRVENSFLASSVRSEISYMNKMWSGDYEGAYDEAIQVLEHINTPNLKGYRALWQYLAGSAAYLVTADGLTDMSARSREYFRQARASAGGGVPWLASLARYTSLESANDDGNDAIGRQVEKIEQKLLDLGVSSAKKFTALEVRIRDGIASDNPKQFEAAQRELGDLLGLSAGKVESPGSPDPWWAFENKCIVFEDFFPESSGAKLSVAKARQAADHPRWIRENVPSLENPEILAVLLSSVERAELGTEPHLTDLTYWGLSEFRAWARTVLASVRELRNHLTESGNLEWRIRAIETLEERRANFATLWTDLKSRPARDNLEIG